MSEYCDWLERVLTHGESVQKSPPEFRSADRSRLHTLLLRAFEITALELAGPSIPFDAEMGIAASQVLAIACWRVASNEPVPALLFRREPDSPSAQLSADLTLRLLPTIYKRAKARGLDHPLLLELEQLLRAWPLSGVLIDFDGTPTGSLDFSGHTGLQRLYAERLLNHGRAGWVPTNGSAPEWAELTFSERGRPLPTISP